jgi:hypothetical protein
MRESSGVVGAGMGEVLVVVFWLLRRRVVRSCLVSRRRQERGSHGHERKERL